MFNNNHEYSPKPYYVNDREPDGAATSMSAFFQGSAGLDSDAQLLSMDSNRGKSALCICRWHWPNNILPNYPDTETK